MVTFTKTIKPPPPVQKVIAPKKKLLIVEDDDSVEEEIKKPAIVEAVKQYQKLNLLKNKKQKK